MEERARVLKARVEELALSMHQQALPEASQCLLGEGGPSSAAGAAAGSSAAAAAGSSAGDELPLLVSTTELGVYVKWSLLLQEHLQQVLAQRDSLAAMRRLLEQENEELRAAIAGPAGAVLAGALGPAGADEPLTRGPSSAETASAGVSPLLSPTAVREREELSALLLTPSVSEELLSTPNLANLVSSLDQGVARQAADASGASALWGRPRS